MVYSTFSYCRSHEAHKFIQFYDVHDMRNRTIILRQIQNVLYHFEMYSVGKSLKYIYIY